ncbi:MAG: hypothetical protein CVT89_00615 [Candidatus Altiarchaeales archaeon HGW-Altiarchaeales-2]|nr:MAG: hypothetical protein CVT89_00615 [Candidatus Altiarchaeales archaeon HGW-Altiarchaeales-2]
MDRKEKYEKARSDVWDKAKNVKDRIKMLKKPASEYPEYMHTFIDMASSYREICDMDNAVKTYLQTIDLKDTFESVWKNELGKAYLFTGDYKKAVENLEKFEISGHDYTNGIFLAFVYLKSGDKKKFKEKIDKWISKNIEISFEMRDYGKYINELFNDEDAKFIGDVWNKYDEKYSGIERYKLYCLLYKQRYIGSIDMDSDDDDDDLSDDEEIPPKLGRSGFEGALREFLSLESRVHLGGARGKEDYDEYFELKDMLFGDIIFKQKRYRLL